MIFDKFKPVCWLCIMTAIATCTANAQDLVWNENVVGSYSFRERGPVSIASNEPTFFESLSIRRMFRDEIGVLKTIENVAIDGIVELDMEVGPEILLTGEAFDGTTTTQISFNGVKDVGDSLLIGTYPQEGGNMFLFPIDPSVRFNLRGIELHAEPGILKHGADASPFGFFIPQAGFPGHVTLASLGTQPTIDSSFELDVFVAPNTPNGSITSPQPHWPEIPIFTTTNLEEFVSPPVTCIIPADDLIGDLDDNGTVEFRDFLILAGNFGIEVDTYGEGDMNCNGTVDFEDFLRLANRFGNTRTAEAHTVPEPSSLGLFLFGFFALAATRKRRRQHIARNTYL